MAARKGWTLVMAVILLGLAAGVAGAQESPQALEISFKLDTATTKGLNMGEVWTAPAKFTGAQAARSFVVEARSVGIISAVNKVDVEATWKSENPAAVRVTPATGKKVKLAVLKPGQWNVVVTSGSLTKKLDIKATQSGGIFQVEIDQ